MSVRVRTGCGNLYLILNIYEGVPFECFSHLGKMGSCTAAMMEALTRCISLGLRCGVPLQEYYDELRLIRCLTPTIDEGEEILSCPDAMGVALREAATALGVKIDSKRFEGLLRAGSRNKQTEGSGHMEGSDGKV